MIAITDQGLKLNGVGSLSNAQSSLYQLSSSNFHDITTGSNGYNAGPGYDLVTGIGTPIANQLVPALVSLDTPDTRLPGSPGLGTPTGSAPVFSHLSVNPSDTFQAPSLNGTTISSSTEPATTSSTSITALIPNTTSTTVNWTVVPIIIVPAPPPPPLVTHMGTSTAPVTAQSSIAISLVEEQPTGLTHFGQGLDNERGKLFEERLDTRPASSSWIDIVEPIQPPAPPTTPKGEQTTPPAKVQAQPLPVLSPAAVDAVFEPFDTNELTGSIGRPFSRANRPAGEENPAWNFSQLFGSAVVVIGGYRLGIHASDRLSGRSLTRQTKTRRWPWR